MRRRSLKKSKRGVFFSIDAMIAASIIVLGLILVSSFYISEKKPTSINYLASDLTQVISSLKISEVNNTYVSQLIADGVIEEKSLNNSIAEILGEMWATNQSEIALNLTIELIEPHIEGRFGYGIYINEEEIRARPKAVEGALISSQKMISGIEKDKAIFGYSSKVYLSSIKDRQTSTFAYFGGFEGQGNLTKRLQLPGSFNITSAYLEVDAGTDFKLYVNGNLCGEFPLGSGNGSYMIPDRWDIKLSECNTSFFAAGVNNILIGFEEINENFTADGPPYIGGGYFRVTYTSDNTTDLEVNYDNDSNAIKRYYFPGIDGFINLYSSFYVPGDLSEMKINLSYYSNAIIYLAFGNITIYENASSGNTTVILNNTEIESILSNNSLNYSSFDAKTIPLRLYLKNETSVAALYDIVLATDVSHSMDYKLNESAIGVKRDCNDSLLNNLDTRRISGARCAAKALVDNVLTLSGPLVGLVSYHWETKDIFNLSNDTTALKTEIETYKDLTVGSCMCCGVRSAADILMVDKIITAISRKSKNWIHNAKDLAAPPAGWTELGFNDNSWKKKTAVFRDKYNSLGNPSTILAKYEGDYYFRKKFNVANVSAINDSKLFVLSDDGADVYLNEVLIDNDYNSSHNALYWNRNRIEVNTSLFVEGENIIAARLYNSETCFEGDCWTSDVAFDLELIISETEINQTKLKAIIVMSDGESDYGCDNDNQSTQEAIDAACDVYSDYGIKVFTIGFGSDADNDTLIAMANCSGGEYFQSLTVQELIDAYDEIINKMVEFTSTQTANISSLPDAHLYPESYIEFNYTPITTPPTYGEIPITIESPIFNNSISEDSIYIPDDVDLISLSATSYSADQWTSYLNLSNSNGLYEVFNLSSYNQDFHDLGDAYQVNIPVNLIKKGEYNIINIMNGIDLYNLSGGSPYNRLIYTVMLKSLLDFSGVFSSNEGCNWSLAFEDGTNNSLLVPLTYNGTKNCDYFSGTYDSDDATDEAAYRLFQNLDLDDDGYLEVRLDESNLMLDFLSISEIPSMWGPAILEVRVWQ